MNKEIAKRAFEDAQKELDETKIERLKEVVKDTLKRISKIDDEIKELTEEKRLLKLDIDDLKEGRLDRIEERQKTDAKAKKVSRIIVERIEVHETVYTPIRVVEVPYRVWPNTTIWCDSLPSTNLTYSTCNTSAVSGNNINCFTLTGNLSKQYTAGAYAIDATHGVTHLR